MTDTHVYAQGKGWIVTQEADDKLVTIDRDDGKETFSLSIPPVWDDQHEGPYERLFNMAASDAEMMRVDEAFNTPWKPA